MEPPQHERPIIMKKGKPIKNTMPPLLRKPLPFFRKGVLTFRQRYFWPISFGVSVGVFALYHKYRIDLMDEELEAHRKKIKEEEERDFEALVAARANKKRQYKVYKPPAE